MVGLCQLYACCYDHDEEQLIECLWLSECWVALMHAQNYFSILLLNQEMW